MLANKKAISSTKSRKAQPPVRDLNASKQASEKITGGKLPGKRKPPTITLKRGKNQS
jgi:hypothetical protein